MKFSKVLFKQHIGRQLRKFWYLQGKRRPYDTKAEEFLSSRRIQVVDPKELVEEKKREIFNFQEVNFLKPQPIKYDKTHPDWKDTPCLFYEDNNLLVEGLQQAQQITKTVVFENTLPQSVERLIEKLTEESHELVKRITKTSVIFDAHQDLLPKIKDPRRPAFVFPRQLGITDIRKISNLSKKFLQLCDCLSGPQIANNRSIIDKALLSFPFEKEFDLFNFCLTMDIMLMSAKPLDPVESVTKHNDIELPNISPLHFSIGLNKRNIYKFENLYPFISGYHKKHVHTIFVYYDNTNIKNTTELEVTESQVFARALLKAFTAAASSARQRFGSNILELPEPVTVQCIQSDGKGFYFSVYQLNTLNIEGEEGVKNYYWTLPKLNLYETGGYVEGKPTLEGYNPEVFEKILAFYKNN